MQAIRLWTVLALLAAAIVPAGAQEAAKPEPVTDHIPAGAVGYVVAPDLSQLGTRLDAFIRDIGMAEQISLEQMGGTMKMIQGQAQLGEGFNPAGGFGVVMLNPKDYDIDLAKMIAEAESGEMQEEPKLPFVLLVPGKGVKEVFGAYQIEDAGEDTHKVEFRAGEMFARKIGGYVALSPLAKTLDAVSKIETQAVKQLPKAAVAEMTKGELFMYVDMKVATPIYLDVLKAARNSARKAAERGDDEAKMAADYIAAILPVYEDMLPQIAHVWAYGDFTESGIVFSESLAFKDDSELGKIVKALKPEAPAKLLAGVPNLPYAMAGAWQQPSDSKQWRDLKSRLVTEMLKTEAFADLPAASRKQIETTYNNLLEQIKQGQFVLGGSPADAGLVGMAMVLKTDEPAKLEKTIVDMAMLSLDAARKANPDNDDLKSFSINYAAGVDTVGDMKVSAMEVVHPALATMDASDRQMMQMVIGEDKVRLLMAQTDDSLVITVGGSKAMLAEAVKAAGSETGAISADEVAAAMKAMGIEKTSAVMLVSTANIYKLVGRAMQKMDPNAGAPPFQPQAKGPIVLALAQDGSTLIYRGYIPNNAVKDMMMPVMMWGMGAPAGPPPGGGMQPAPAPVGEDW